MVHHRSVYLSAGCEARSHCLAACRQSNRVFFASHSQLVLADADKPHSCLVSVSPRHHTRPISCVKRIHGCLDGSIELFVSGGCDGFVNLWRLRNNNIEHIARLDGLVPAKPAAVSSVAGVCGWWLEDGRVVVGAAARGRVLLWKVHVGGEGASPPEVIVDDDKIFVLSMDIQRAQRDEEGEVPAFLLALGTSKRCIDVYTGVVGDEMNGSLSLALRIPSAHEDWVHALAFDENEMEPLLASCGQDAVVKLWRFERMKEEGEGEKRLLAVKKMICDVREGGSTITQLSAKIDAVLSGHEDWVHSVEWETKRETSATARLVTAGSDKAVLVWERDEDSGVWMDTVRLGVIGGQAAGFYGAALTADGETLVADSFYGGLHAWRRRGDGESWQARAFGGGHCGAVNDIQWSEGGSYLLSASGDKTTRLHARVRYTQGEPTQFVELGRPQVHGHEVQCLAALPQGGFVSGSEEKILRVFEMPRSVAESLRVIAGETSMEKEGLRPLSSMPWGAAVPALGLSNNAVEKEEEKGGEGNETPGGSGDGEGDDVHWEEQSFVSRPTVLTGPPTEECMQQNTLWPEVTKLYGHGFELYTVSVGGGEGEETTVVSGCRASQAEHAALLQWQPPEYTEAPRQIGGHTLTVTQTAFSPDGSLLLSVSRDRTAIVYKKQKEGASSPSWNAVWQSPSKGGPHSRIIWSCAWMDDSRHFLTVSREAKIVVWRWTGEEAEVVVVHTGEESVNAVDTARIREGEALSSHIIVIGYEGGAVDVLQVEEDEEGGEKKRGMRRIDRLVEGAMDKAEDHTVTRLRFAPRSSDGRLLLAVATANKKLHVIEITQ